MVVYIEYAFLQNFLFDGGLLCLAFLTSGAKLCPWRILLSATVGACFALIFPFLRLPSFLLTLLKLSVGGLLCLIAFRGLKGRKEWGRYALTTILFYAFTFGFGGALTLFWGKLPRKFPLFWTGVAFVGLTGISLWLIGKLRQKKAVSAWIYACEIRGEEKSVRAQGYLDSGNLATKYGVPVCFLSTDLFYDLWGEEFAFCDATKNGKRGGQGFDKMKIKTLAGEREIPLKIGVLSVQITGKKKGEKREKRVYFAPSANMITREYNLLLNARVFED